MFSLVNKKLEENKIEECKYEEKNPSENENILSEVISVYDYNEKKSGINRDKLQEEFENMLFEEEKDNFDKKNCLESANAAKSIEKIKVNSVNVLIFECIYCNIDLAHENFWFCCICLSFFLCFQCKLKVTKHIHNLHEVSHQKLKDSIKKLFDLGFTHKTKMISSLIANEYDFNSSVSQLLS